MNKKHLEDLKNRDELKKELCKKQNVLLFIIRQFKQRLSEKQKFNLICKEVKRCGFSIDKPFNHELSYDLEPKKLEKIIKQGKEKNLLFLGIKRENAYVQAYMGVHEKHFYKCLICNYIHEKEPNSVAQGIGCPKCAKNKVFTLEECRQKIKNYNLLCLSNKYKNRDTIMLWKCTICNCIWETSFGTILRKQEKSCPKCFPIRRSKENTYSYIEAKKMLTKLKIYSRYIYIKTYKKDSKLPSNPDIYYKKTGEWSTWKHFLSEKPEIFYKNYTDAQIASQCLNIQTKREYKKQYKKDAKLPSNPNRYYKNKGWYSWYKFLGTNKKVNKQ